MSAERATRATTVPVDLLAAAKAVVGAYVREDGDEVAIAVTGSDLDHRQYDSMLALLAAIHSTPAPEIDVEALARAMNEVRWPGTVSGPEDLPEAAAVAAEYARQREGTA